MLHSNIKVKLSKSVSQTLFLWHFLGDPAWHDIEEWIDLPLVAGVALLTLIIGFNNTSVDWHTQLASMALAEKEGLVSDVPELARTFCRAKFLLNSFRRMNIGLLFWDGVASLDCCIFQRPGGLAQLVGKLGSSWEEHLIINFSGQPAFAGQFGTIYLTLCRIFWVRVVTCWQYSVSQHGQEKQAGTMKWYQRQAEY